MEFVLNSLLIIPVFIFEYIVKPFCLYFIKVQYVLCLAYWNVVAFGYKMAILLESDKKKQLALTQKLNDLPFPHPDIYRDPLDIILANGYFVEVHSIKTADNYILKAWRLYKDPKLLGQTFPIMLQHGLLDCSWSWFLNNNKHALPFALCDQGYDVWVMNNRGNLYSQGHTVFKNIGENKGFWNYSFDDIVKYDVDANLLYVKRVTKKEKVIYIGHSQGTSQIFAKITQDPTFQQHIQCFIAFGPAIYVANIKSRFIKMVAKYRLLDIFYWMGHPSLLVMDKDSHQNIGGLCYMFPWIYQTFLFSIVNLLCGYPRRNKIDLSRFGVMVTHEPGGASVKNVLHWIQFIRRKQFAMFDYGSKYNLQVYGQNTPPVYNCENLKQFTIPKYLYIGSKDVICDETDIQNLISTLSPENLHVEHINDYAHLDYVWAVDAYETLYKNVLQVINEHQIKQV